MAQDRGEHVDGRRLAVRAGDGEPRGGAFAGAHAPGELDLSPHGYAGRRRGEHERVVRRDPGRGDDELGPRRGLDHVLRAETDVDIEDLEDRRTLADRLGLVAGDRDDVRAAVGQGVGGREAGHAEADDEDADARPVGVAVGQSLAGLVERVEGHWDPTTHSA